MKLVTVQSRSGNYQIRIGAEELRETGKILARAGFRGAVMVITQAKIAKLYFREVERSLVSAGFRVVRCDVPDGEIAKSEKELFKIHRRLLSAGFERKDSILALGGGVVGDLAGFAAATYLRGIAFANAGTTLLAQVDSSIGGKTAIDLAEGKNLVGAFYPPRVVISDTAVLKTLPSRDFTASLAEVVKYGVIRDSQLFQLLEVHTSEVLRRRPEWLERLVVSSSKIKAAVVSRDEFETQQERMILNFGHTFGHGFEQAAGYGKMLHGEAVSVGMLAAARLAVFLGLFSAKEEARLQRLLLKLKLPVSVSRFRMKALKVLAAMMNDKKKKSGSLRFILPVKIGQVCIVDQIPPSLILKIAREFGAL